MLRKIKALFGRPLTLEVSASRVPLRMEPDVQQAVLALSSHPGFRYLVDKLDLQAAYLRAKLVGERYASIREVDALQAGIAWCEWLRSQVERETETVNRRQTQHPLEEEMRLFRELDQQLERVVPPSPSVPA